MKSRPIRLVLFDIDGTLIHTAGAGVTAFARAFHSEFGIPEGTETLKFAGRTDVSLVREFFTRQNIEATAKNFERFFAAYVAWLEKLIVERVGGACPGVLEFHGILEKRTDPPLMGLLTGNIRRGAQIKLERYKLWHKFEFGGFADDHEERDQIAAIAHQRGNERIGRELDGSEVLVIGDTPLDIRCAHAIGARVLAVATGTFTVAELQAHQPDWVVEDLSKFDVGKI